VSGKSTIEQMGDTKGTVNSLSQNVPNPFDGSTVIAYSIADVARGARIDIVYENGTLWKSFSGLSTGHGQLIISAGSIPPGTYTYALFVAGSKVDSKKMVVLQ